jgi:hypothetical protein
MLVVASAYSAHLGLCLYIYCLCFLSVLYRGNASKPSVVVEGVTHAVGHDRGLH